MQNLPISKMNCADSTERPLKLPEPVFHCVDIFHHQLDNIDVPAGIPELEQGASDTIKFGRHLSIEDDFILSN